MSNNIILLPVLARQAPFHFFSVKIKLSMFVLFFFSFLENIHFFYSNIVHYVMKALVLTLAHSSFRKKSWIYIPAYFPVNIFFQRGEPFYATQ